MKQHFYLYLYLSIYLYIINIYSMLILLMSDISMITLKKKEKMYIFSSQQL